MISSVRADAFVPSGGKSAMVQVRKAAMHDIAPILHLINGYAVRGVMLARTEFELSEAIRDFSVATLEGELLGAEVAVDGNECPRHRARGRADVIQQLRDRRIRRRGQAVRQRARVQIDRLVAGRRSLRGG